MIWSSLITFLLAALIQLAFWAGLFSRPWKKQALKHHPLPECLPVSLIVCVRNEAENLEKNLPYWLEQDYPAFEVIVVDDNSFDKSGEIVLGFRKKYRNLRLVSLDRATRPGKKDALSAGILAARFEILLLTDADCRPAGPDWIKEMQRPVRSAIEIALGYGPYLKRSGLLNRFIRFEATYTAIQYFSFAHAGIPYMGVGRNLAYRRELFFRTGGFGAHAHLTSGDDDLFINQAAHAANTTFILQPGAFTFSAPETNWRGYYHQKKRHLSAGSHYRFKHRLLLGILAASHFAFYASGLCWWILQPRCWPLIAAIYLVRMGVVLLVWKNAAGRLEQRDLLPLVPMFDFLFLAYYPCFAPALITGSQLKQWK
jgi:poly-beta-1,6-N-acetyl-D-glucosamine synthase